MIHLFRLFWLMVYYMPHIVFGSIFSPWYPAVWMNLIITSRCFHWNDWNDGNWIRGIIPKWLTLPHISIWYQIFTWTGIDSPVTPLHFHVSPVGCGVFHKWGYPIQWLVDNGTCFSNAMNMPWSLQIRMGMPISGNLHVIFCRISRKFLETSGESRCRSQPMLLWHWSLMGSTCDVAWSRAGRVNRGDPEGIVLGDVTKTEPGWEALGIFLSLGDFSKAGDLLWNSWEWFGSSIFGGF